MQHTNHCHCDACLLAQMQSADAQLRQQGWEAWYTRDHKAVQRYLARRCHGLGCPEQGEDILHDTFIIAFKNIATGRYQASGRPLGAYLHGIARNRLYDLMRLQQKEMPDEEYLLSCTSSALPVEDQIYLERVLASVHEAHAHLAENYRQVIESLYAQEKNSQEVGTELCKSANNIRTMARRAVNAIGVYLTGHYDLRIPPDAIRLSLRLLYDAKLIPA
ncbi:MAG: RNA polymerase sigma factor [Caldilineaceae bacterium]|nr:RNA polymerase sigma factor [Caldilineaceae bacterium]